MNAIKVIAENKKARFDYEILETYEAGIELLGPEVKSIRDGHISLKESFVTAKDNQLWLNNAYVSAYKPAATMNPEPTRARRLLLKRETIDKLIGSAAASGNTIVPTKIYLSHGLIKIEIALARGRKKYDKRELLKKRQIAKDTASELKNAQK